MRAQLDLFALQVSEALRYLLFFILTSKCSLIGIAGLVISDQILGRDLSVKLRNRFEQSLEEEFTECDGRILPIRSEFTGLTVHFQIAF